MTTLTRNTDILRAEVSAHIAADALVRGSYWRAGKTDVGGKGCFIGCLTHSDDPAPAFERFGLPIAVLRIAENIFEALPDDEGKAFFSELPDAVGRDGKDLSRVHWAFLAAELRALPKTTDAVQAVIDPVIAGMDLLASSQEWPAADAVTDAAISADAATASALAASDAAADAAYAAIAAARAAAIAASDAATDATDAADAVTYAAISAAYASDAATDARLRQRDTLLALIAAA
jgi:hypothetical protein